MRFGRANTSASHRCANDFIDRYTSKCSTSTSTPSYYCITNECS